MWFFDLYINKSKSNLLGSTKYYTSSRESKLVYIWFLIYARWVGTYWPQCAIMFAIILPKCLLEAFWTRIGVNMFEHDQAPTATYALFYFDSCFSPKRDEIKLYFSDRDNNLSILDVIQFLKYYSEGRYGNPFQRSFSAYF